MMLFQAGSLKGAILAPGVAGRMVCFLIFSRNDKHLSSDSGSRLRGPQLHYMLCLLLSFFAASIDNNLTPEAIGLEAC
jgi:hypothetical protein